MATYRVMAIQEEGSECCLASGLSEQAAYDSLSGYREDYPEFRSIWVEIERDYYTEARPEEWDDPMSDYYS